MVVLIWGSFETEGKILIEDGGSYIYDKLSDAVLAPVTQSGLSENTVPLSDTEYVVKSGDSLSKIAEIYDITAEKLKVYNDIEDEYKLSIGQIIKIPPDYYTLPENSPIQDNNATEPSDTGDKANLQVQENLSESSGDADTSAYTAQTHQ